MTASGFLHDIGKMLECPICLEVYDRPVGLWCGHTLCEPCFRATINCGSVSCPLCRKRTRVHQNGPPILYTIKDITQLYTKQIEERKYVANILPILSNRTTRIETTTTPPKEDESTPDENSTVLSSGGAKPFTCVNCSRSGAIEDFWVCEECRSSATCSKCSLLSHKSHKLSLLNELLENRRLVVMKWRQTCTHSLEMLYKNRMEIDVNDTRLRFLRLQLESKRTELTAGNNRKTLDDADEENVAKLTSEAMGKFKMLSDNLKCIDKTEFLLSVEENFTNELHDLRVVVTKFLREQEILLKKQERLRDVLHVTLNPKPIQQQQSCVQSTPKRMPNNVQRNRTGPDLRRATSFNSGYNPRGRNRYRGAGAGGGGDPNLYNPNNSRVA